MSTASRAHPQASRARAVDAGLLDDAAAAPGILPAHERLVELNTRLRSEIARLKPVVERQADGMYHGSTDWYRRRSALNATRTCLADELSADRRYAAMHVAELGRRLRALDGFVQEARHGQ